MLLVVIPGLPVLRSLVRRGNPESRIFVIPGLTRNPELNKMDSLSPPFGFAGTSFAGMTLKE